MDNNPTENKKSEFLPHLIILAAFFLLLSQTWLKWGSLIVDTGRELWLPGELLKGKVLYRDIVSYYGFLPAYLIAGLYEVFGIGINTLVYAGIAVTLITSFTVYRISRFFLDQGFSTLLVINFLFVFAFAGYCIYGIFNWILPYSFATTLFMMFTALSLYYFLKFIFWGNEQNLAIWTVFLTAAFLCRLESALTVWPAFFVTSLMPAIPRQNIRRFKMLTYTTSPLAASALLYGLFFAITHTFHAFWQMFTGSIHFHINTPFYRELMGTDNIPLSLSRISLSFLITIAVFIGLAIICRVTNSLYKDESPVKTIIPILAAFIFFILIKQFSLYGIQYNCLILVLFCGTIAYLFQALNRTAAPRSIGLLILFTISFLIASRILLNTTPFEYGFFLLATPLICYYIFFADLFKNMLERHLKIPAEPLSAAIACFMILMIIPYWEFSRVNYNDYSRFVATAKGNRYCLHNAQTEVVCKTTDYIKNNTPQNSTVAVFPEGVGINFFTSRALPLKYHGFLPPDIRLFGEDKILSEIKAAKIDYIVIIARYTGDMGAGPFGIAYAQKIKKWIDDNYAPVKQFGTTPYISCKWCRCAGALILKKRF